MKTPDQIERDEMRKIIRAGNDNKPFDLLSFVIETGEMYNRLFVPRVPTNPQTYEDTGKDI